MRYLILAVSLLVLTPAAAHAACESPWVSADQMQARLICATNDKGGMDAGIEVRLSPQWHTYWRTPGDSGLPPTLNWEGSQNLNNAQLLWPVPKRIDIMGLQSFGYEGQVLFPLDIKATDATKPVILNLTADFMVCHEMCIPQTVKISLPLTDDQTYTRLLARAHENLPTTEGGPALEIKSVVLGPDALVVNAWSGQGFDNADLFVETDGAALTAKPAITPDEKEKRSALLRVTKPEGTENLAATLAGKSVTVTLTNGAKSVEKKVQF